MIVLSEERVIILHTPKCAGKNLRQAFMPDNPEGPYWHWKYIPEISSWADCAHLPLDIMRQLPEWEKIKSFIVIAMVRNPYDRFIGALREHLLQHDTETIETTLQEIDEVRINHDPRYIHFIPQNRFTQIGNKRYADFIVRVEKIQEDLKSVATKANLSEKFSKAIDRIEKPKNTVEYSDFLKSSASRELVLNMVKRLYFRDFLLYGYTLPDVLIEPKQDEPIFEYLLAAPGVMDEWNDNRIPSPPYDRFQKKQELLLDMERAVRERDIAIIERDVAVRERETAIGERNTLLDSTSWKVTKPIRLLKRIIT